MELAIRLGSVAIDNLSAIIGLRMRHGPPQSAGRWLVSMAAAYCIRSQVVGNFEREIRTNHLSTLYLAALTVSRRGLYLARLIGLTGRLLMERVR